MRIGRARIEHAIEQLISMLDEINGDPDFEPEPPEEQHDVEADLTWTSRDLPTFYVIAERARRRAKGQ